MKSKITKEHPTVTKSRRVYRWRVSPPPGSDFEEVEVLGASRYEAVIAAAKLWRTP